MKPIPSLLCALVLSFGSASAALAAADTYQVTGPILAISDNTIVVEKNQERWEIARDAQTKADSALKVGDKVTVHYRMFATKVDRKPADAPTSSSHSADRAPAANTPAKVKSK